MKAMNMIRKTARLLLAFLLRVKRKFRSKPGTAISIPVTEPAVEVPARQSEPPSVQRIRSAVSCPGVRQRKGCTPGVWIVEAESFAAAYRFLLRMCDPSHVRTIRQAGHVRYRAELPDGVGSILLSERVGNRKNTLAVMTFSVGRMPEIKELRFCARNRPFR